jgi:hypothetical protein
MVEQKGGEGSTVEEEEEMKLEGRKEANQERGIE